MYARFYNLKEMPFNLTPDSHFLYLSRQHRDALGHLLYGIKERKGFMLITGEVGTGKTTLCRSLIREIEKEAEVGFILNSFLSSQELLKAINQDLSCHRGAGTTKELVDELNRFLIEKHQAGKPIVVLIDECQNLSSQALEQLRMLSNLETEKDKLIQIVMVGQPELREKLESANLRQLAQRVSVTYHLAPLDYADTVRYIQHRLHIARGGNGDGGMGIPFTWAALRRIYLFSEGIPRKINIICDRALLVGYARGKKIVIDRFVRIAIQEIRRHPRPSRAGYRRIGLRSIGKIIAPVGVAAALALVLHHFSPPLRAWRGAISGPSLRTTKTSVVTAPGITNRKSPPLSDGTPSRNDALLLAQLWGKTGAEPGKSAHSTDPHAFASRSGLKTVSCWAPSEFIRAVNIPCLVRIRDRGTERNALLKSIDKSVARLVSEEGKDEVAECTDSRLSGRVTYYYPVEISLPDILVPGMSGSSVREYQGYLSQSRWFSGDEDGWYGPKTEDAVKQFQRHHGLPEDGVLGINEIILLRSMSASGSVPRLARQELAQSFQGG